MEAKFICLEEPAFFELVEIVVERMATKFNSPTRKWIDGTEAMERLNCKKTKLQGLRDSGQIEYSKMDGVILYNSLSIDDYIERHKRETF